MRSYYKFPGIAPGFPEGKLSPSEVPWLLEHNNDGECEVLPFKGDVTRIEGSEIVS